MKRLILIGCMVLAVVLVTAVISVTISVRLVDAKYGAAVVLLKSEVVPTQAPPPPPGGVQDVKEVTYTNLYLGLRDGRLLWIQNP